MPELPRRGAGAGDLALDAPATDFFPALRGFTGAVMPLRGLAAVFAAVFAPRAPLACLPVVLRAAEREVPARIGWFKQLIARSLRALALCTAALSTLASAAFATACAATTALANALGR